jgi:hypothetical protein
MALGHTSVCARDEDDDNDWHVAARKPCANAGALGAGSGAPLAKGTAFGSAAAGLVGVPFLILAPAPPSLFAATDFFGEAFFFPLPGVCGASVLGTPFIRIFSLASNVFPVDPSSYRVDSI